MLARFLKGVTLSIAESNMEDEHAVLPDLDSCKPTCECGSLIGTCLVLGSKATGSCLC